ncbi:hypothetical protein [Xylanibacter brevis]|uniref:hypothetical protein n=1 Tax=Xylanibacter brevis TaxID=83231 RepID=UPI0012DE575C|nr:hypothetical protein [Xylanibacter brevis]
MKKRILTMLVLLMTAVTGAWAESKPIGLNVEYEVGDEITSTTDVYVYYGEQSGTLKKMGVKITSTQPLTISMIFDDSFEFNGDDAVYYLPDGVATGGSAGAIPCVGESTGDATVVHVASGSGTLADPYVFAPGSASSASAGYTVSMKEGTEDADKWTINPNPAAEGQTVTATYSGTRRVKSVKAVKKSAAKTLAEVTAGDIGKIVGKDGKIYATKADAEAVATGNAVAMIAYVGTASDCTHGLAIALADESDTKKYGDAGTACSGKEAVTGGTWRLPSEKDWQYIFIGCGSSESYSAPTEGMKKSYSGLASKLTTAQGDALQAECYYWSSTESNPGSHAWGVYIYGGGNAEFYAPNEGNAFRVRACLAFTVEQSAPTGNIVDLSTLTGNYEAQNGEVLTGTLAGNYKISIADGATVTLDGVTINGVNDINYEWAGITCLGDATIILSGTNTVKGFYEDYPGIQAAAGKTLIINGTGSLTASSYGYATAIGGGSGVACGDIEIQGGTITATSGGLGAGIGGGYNASCGNITISGGTVIATGGNNSAGIGGGYNASWGNITISGGTVTATGGQYGAGIGGGKRGPASFSCGNIIISGGTVTATGGDNAAGIGGGRGNNNKNFSSCGDITITTGVTEVTATKGSDATNSIGAGYYGTCGTVTIGGNVGAITTSPYTYQPSN